jgi:putative holliday junction resolvase
MTRWLGIDYGKKRIGLAISDPGETISSPIATLEATGTVSDDVRQILKWANQNEITAIVVGLPLNMDGSAGRQAEITERFAGQLRTTGTLPVELWDERLSSFQADEYLNLAEIAPAKRKKMRDALAAHVILQSFLDARKSREREGDSNPLD